MLKRAAAQYFKNPTVTVFVVALFVGILLRVYNYWDNVFFGFDQARDLQQIYDMVHEGDFKLVGPGTDIVGLFNGPLFLYLLMPAYALSSFNPNIAALVLIAINVIGAILLFTFGKLLFNEKVGAVAAILWAISYEQVNFSRFISNASPLPVCAIIFFLGLYLFFVRKKEMGLPISALGIGLGIQFDFYLVYLLAFCPLMYILFPRTIRPKTIIIAIAVLGLLLSTFALAEIRFQFQGVRSLIGYLGEQRPSGDALSKLFSFVTSMERTLTLSFVSFNGKAALALLLVSLGVFLSHEKDRQKRLFLLLWLFSTLPLFAFQSGVVGGNYIHATVHGAIYMLVAYLVVRLMSTALPLGIGVAALILVSNGHLFVSDNFVAARVLGYQKMLYGQQKEVMDYTYQGGGEFSICTISNPLFVNMLWSSLYKSYGEQTYGFLPYYAGPKQEGKTYLPYDTKRVKDRYLIIEPNTGFQDAAKQATIYIEDQVSTIVEERQFGEIRVQKRVLDPVVSAPRDTQGLSASERGTIREITKEDYRYSCSLTY